MEVRRLRRLIRRCLVDPRIVLTPLLALSAPFRLLVEISPGSTFTVARMDPAPLGPDLLTRATSCEVCLELFSGDHESRRARFLPACGHSFCHACICELLGSVGFPVPVTAAPKGCPACRAPIPTGVSAAELPRNFALEHVARVIAGMGSDVWMAAAMIAENAATSLPTTAPSRVWPALPCREPPPPVDPSPSPPPAALGVSTHGTPAPPPPPVLRARPPHSAPSRSALALAASGVPAPACAAGLLAILRLHGGPLSLSALCERVGSAAPRLWPPIGFLPRYFGERCLAVPASALLRPDPALLRAFVQWATAPERGKAAAGACAATVVRGAEPLHLERVRNGSLAEVVCAGGSGCALARSARSGTGAGASIAAASSTGSLGEGRYVPPCARTALPEAGATSARNGSLEQTRRGGAPPLAPRLPPRRYHADDAGSFEPEDDPGSGYVSWDEYDER